MGNKILVILALKEKALLEKKLRSYLNSASFVDIMKPNGDTVWNNHISKTRYCQEAECAYSRITGLIRRYLQLLAAIAESNAHTTIHTSCGVYTVATALTLRNYLRECPYYQDGTRDFGVQLYDNITAEYTHCLALIGEKNKELQQTAEDTGIHILQQKFVPRENDVLKQVNAFVTENTMELVDPLDIRKRAEELMEKRSRFLSELDTQIQISNAATYITLENGESACTL